MAAAATIPMLHKSSHVVDVSSSSELFELGNLVLVDFSSFGGSRVFLGSTSSNSVSLHSLAANKHSNSYMEDSNKKLFKVVRINE